MSENATRISDGERIKIGTCESMYYLRFDQRGDVQYPWPTLSDDPEQLDPFLYRFPDPHEDGTKPGEYDGAWGGIKLSIPGFWGQFEGVEHGVIQATARNGYLFNLPCPEGKPDLYRGPYAEAPQAHRNGGTTTLVITAQRWYAGRLVLVISCAGCDHQIRLPELTDALPVLEALQREGDAKLQEAKRYWGGPDTSEEQRAQIQANMARRAGYWFEVAKRITAGYSGVTK
jgi:hypothetical protein